MVFQALALELPRVGPFSIIDIVLMALLLFSFIFGIIRGLKKSIDGLYGLHVIFLVSIVASYLIVAGLGSAVSPVSNLSVIKKMSTSVEQTLMNYKDFYGFPAMYEDGVLKVGVGDTYVPVTEKIDEGTGFGVLFSDLINKCIPEDSFSDGQTIANYFASKVTQLACIGVIFIILGIILRILLGVLSKLMRNKIEESDSYRKVDKVLGGVAHIVDRATSFLVLMFIYSLLISLPQLEPVTEVINQSVLGKFLLGLFVK